ncbi:hypothetical protein BST97_07035 [Nonlabens spongiae]|uniref:Uncharacterized protein n=2 Tax=Nonlabens spongiae TaxID=331648 RepID=A0A1W6MJM0_9FLAO|nr:hypothetical protein BST97_07035 [Nonlabens spongiae]
MFYFEDITNLFQNFRSFNLGNLYGEKLSSGTVKLEIFIEWLAEILNGSLENTLLFIFGSGVIVDQFDFDLGYILQMFGFLGLTSIFLFIISIFRKTPKQNRYIYFIFLISIGATLIINFRFSILTFMILSMYLQPQLKNGR